MQGAYQVSGTRQPTNTQLRKVRNFAKCFHISRTLLDVFVPRVHHTNSSDANFIVIVIGQGLIESGVDGYTMALAG